ncbi:hypothetical protein SSP24_30170 [Streptomyces spinoverrucosus]|uniref:Uncharacterized protein n=1 Tax=Streptomyces spinoverrucosus TaxID=284043 RepID=A0A4Y3VE35_9ACTN|nr:hypothetical protein [Streptomyces spinoverrucosus]GEC05362.1 hypothetical protein SSP24_30170 [Streptomyces spinoverrucosus]GHB78890.1 hypothetical protein GCM10010397_56880 [Streptomyces spinoverrucosus]
MNQVDLPLPVVRRSSEHVDARALERDLRDRVDGEVRFDPGTRAAHSKDGSNAPPACAERARSSYGSDPDAH